MPVSQCCHHQPKKAAGRRQTRHFLCLPRTTPCNATRFGWRVLAMRLISYVNACIMVASARVLSSSSTVPPVLSFSFWSFLICSAVALSSLNILTATSCWSRQRPRRTSPKFPSPSDPSSTFRSDWGMMTHTPARADWVGPVHG